MTLQVSELDLYRALSTPRWDAVAGLRDITKCMILLGYSSIDMEVSKMLDCRITTEVEGLFRQLEKAQDAAYIARLVVSIERRLFQLPGGRSVLKSVPVQDMIAAYKSAADAYKKE